MNYQKSNPNRDLSIREFALAMFEAMDTATSLAAYICIKADDGDAYLSLSVNPQDYLDNFAPAEFLSSRGITAYAVNAQAVNLLKKFDKLPTSINRRVTAMKEFLRCESICKSTNERLRSFPENRWVNPRIPLVFNLMVRKIATILGEVPNPENMDFTFGPGSSLNVSRDTSVFKKLTSPLECTLDFVPTLSSFLEEFPGWITPGIHDVKIVNGSKLGFVPKNAKTDRPICIEPLLNGLMQKGIGAHIRRRLLRFGIDLNDQSINQRLAQKAFSHDLSTVDFTSASDTISARLVLDILPIDWYDLLYNCRSPNYDFEGHTYAFQKFSSMGNAYTFELESLIFFAMATATCEAEGVSYDLGENKNLSVYGDDVVIPSSAFDLFSEVADYLGFSVSKAKSFTRGSNFFESCGTDYLYGISVRPFYLKKASRLKGQMGIYYVANSIQRWIAERRPATSNSSSRFLAMRNVYRFVVDHIPRSQRLYGPEGYGDGHLVGFSSDRYARKSFAERQGWCGYHFKTLVYRVRRVKSPNLDENAFSVWPISYCLYQAMNIGPSYTISSDAYSVRQETERTKRISVYVLTDV